MNKKRKVLRVIGQGNGDDFRGRSVQQKNGNKNRGKSLSLSKKKGGNQFRSKSNGKGNKRFNKGQK